MNEGMNVNSSILNVSLTLITAQKAKPQQSYTFLKDNAILNPDSLLFTNNCDLIIDDTQPVQARMNALVKKL